MTRPPRSLGFLLFGALVAGCTDPADAPDDGLVSEFGRYEGYSEPLYDSWVNTSRYVEMRDGVRLAVDVTFPAVGGEAAPGPFPSCGPTPLPPESGRTGAVLRPGRGRGARGQLAGRCERRAPAPGTARLRRGRGAGARRRGVLRDLPGLFSEAETDDAREMIEWFATQPWSDGNVGMYGGSYLGMTQYMAASEMHPALKAIFPNVAGLDLYDQLHPGGIYRKDMIDHWGSLTRNLDINWAAPPVDEDTDGSLLQAAIAEHEANWDVAVEYAAGRFRGSRHPDADLDRARRLGRAGRSEGGRGAGVPLERLVRHLRPRRGAPVGQLRRASEAGHRRLVACRDARQPPDGRERRTHGGGAARWFDYWLKGIDNGIMDESPIHYAVMNDPGDWTWTSADSWPLPRPRKPSGIWPEDRRGASSR